MSIHELIPIKPLVPNTVPQKEPTHEDIERHTEEFIKRGGKVRYFESGERGRELISSDFAINGKKMADRIEEYLSKKKAG